MFIRVFDIHPDEKVILTTKATEKMKWKHRSSSAPNNRKFKEIDPHFEEALNFFDNKSNYTLKYQFSKKNRNSNDFDMLGKDISYPSSMGMKHFNTFILDKMGKKKYYQKIKSNNNYSNNNNNIYDDESMNNKNDEFSSFDKSIKSQKLLKNGISGKEDDGYNVNDDNEVLNQFNSTLKMKFDGKKSRKSKEDFHKTSSNKLKIIGEGQDVEKVDKDVDFKRVEKIEKDLEKRKNSSNNNEIERGKNAFNKHDIEGEKNIFSRYDLEKGTLSKFELEKIKQNKLKSGLENNSSENKNVSLDDKVCKKKSDNEIGSLEKSQSYSEFETLDKFKSSDENKKENKSKGLKSKTNNEYSSKKNMQDRKRSHSEGGDSLSGDSDEYLDLSDMESSSNSDSNNNLHTEKDKKFSRRKKNRRLLLTPSYFYYH
jgi:hypothetical protein